MRRFRSGAASGSDGAERRAATVRRQSADAPGVTTRAGRQFLVRRRRIWGSHENAGVGAEAPGGGRDH